MAVEKENKPQWYYITMNGCWKEESATSSHITMNGCWKGE